MIGAGTACTEPRVSAMTDLRRMADKISWYAAVCFRPDNLRYFSATNNHVGLERFF